MLSTVGQQYFAGQTFEYPLVEGVKTPRVLVPLPEINQPNIQIKDLGDLKGTQDLLRRQKAEHSSGGRRGLWRDRRGLRQPLLPVPLSGGGG